LRFLVDEQLPTALARWISAKGFDCRHVCDAGLAGKSDTAVWSWALRSGATLLTKDEDFVFLSRQKPGCAVVWFTVGNTPNTALLAKMDSVFTQVCAGLEAGETLIVVR
jgi:predicted nuclease of predicted toxin-antitoxin system